MPNIFSNNILEQDIEKICSAELPWGDFENKTVLISGANGYVPAYFVHAFLKRNDINNAGIKVIALCRNLQNAKERFAQYLQRPDFSLCIQDVCVPIRIDEDVNYFIHAASPAGISRHADPVATLNANIIGAINMLEFAQKKSCNGFLFLSSVDVYGNIPDAERFTETMHGTLDDLNVRNAYACGKRAAEALCAAYHVKYSMPVVIVRPSQVLGPGIALNDGRLHIDFISQMVSSDKIVLKSDGSAKRSFIYITDAIAGMLTVMLKGKHGEAYNVIDENGELSVLDLATEMAKLVADRDVKVVFDYEQRNAIEVTGAVPVVTGSSKKLRGLGWEPRTEILIGIDRMMRYYGLNTVGESK